MKLGWNIAAGFANSAWTAVVTLGVIPFYLRYLGMESYGLVGFFAALQAVFGLLDMGLAPTINREVARSVTDEDRARARDLLHTLSCVYWVLAVAIAVTSAAASGVIGRYWFGASSLPHQLVARAVVLMGLVIALRFPLGLYLGALMGAQRMISASAIEIAMVSLANIGAVIVLAEVSPTIQAFFLWQAFVALLNVLVVRMAAWRALRVSTRDRSPRFDRLGLQRVWRFSAGMGMTAVLGTIFMQSDKVILSKLVSLDALGRYTLGALAARSLYVFLTPAFGAIYPRLAAMHAGGGETDIRAFYRLGTRLLMAVIFPAAGFMAVFSSQIITLWTGSPSLGVSVGPVVTWMVIGTAFNGAMHFPYALQLASGRSDLPVKINLVLMVIYAPLLWMLVRADGIVGGAAAWAILNGLYLLLGTALTHRTLLRGVGLKWLIMDVGAPLVVAMAVVGAGGYVVLSFSLSPLPTLILGGLFASAALLLIVGTTPGIVQGALRWRVTLTESQKGVTRDRVT